MNDMLKIGRASVVAAACTLLSAAPVFAQSEPIQLKWAYPSPPTSWTNTKGIAPWSKAVEADAGGTIEFKLYPGGSIGTFRTVYDRLMNGVADVAFGTFGEITGQYQKTTVSQVPSDVQRSSEVGIALWRLYDKGIISDEYGQVKPLALFSFGLPVLHSVKPLNRIEELRGTKVIATSRTVGQSYTLLGAAPITLTPAELYSALQRGLAAGASNSWPGGVVFKLDEVTKHHLDMPFGLGGGYFFMNKDAYAKLPDKARAAIDRHAGEGFSRMVGLASDEEDTEARAKIMANPGHFHDKLSPEEAARWKQLLTPIAEEWVAATPDGAKVLAAYRAELAAMRTAR
jgi:TRAP-type C4-dicarboxylate transport system substrate-binding protein